MLNIEDRKSSWGLLEFLNLVKLSLFHHTVCLTFGSSIISIISVISCILLIQKRWRRYVDKNLSSRRRSEWCPTRSDRTLRRRSRYSYRLSATWCSHGLPELLSHASPAAVFCPREWVTSDIHNGDKTSALCNNRKTYTVFIVHLLSNNYCTNTVFF
jgi:hypothetical protein